MSRNRIMRLLSMLFAISIIVINIALTNVSLAANHTDVIFGMSKEDAVAILGQPLQSSNQDTKVRDDVDLYRYNDISVSKYDDAILDLFFRNNSLYCKSFNFKDNNMQKYAYLKNAMIQKYGEEGDDVKGMIPYIQSILPIEVDEAVVKSVIQAGVFKNVISWRQEDNTYITLFYCPADDEGLTTLCYSLPDEATPISEYNDEGL